MYETFFKFHSRPFAFAPQTDAYFPATLIENSRRTLTRLIERSEGTGLIIGPPGTGKTLLCQLLAEQFQDEFGVALLTCGRLKTPQAMLQAILYELGLPCRGVDEGELRLTLLDYLEPRAEGSKGLLLLVDEAHTLASRLLDEVRLLTNVVRNGEPRVRVVLAGGTALEERFANPKLASFSQRVAGRCYLEPLDSCETANYVRAQIKSAGADPARLIDEQALKSIYRASDGIPRLINQVCDHALILANLAGQQRLASEVVDEAWADLQQLPPPWTGDSPSGASSDSVVEFGKLGGAGDEPLESIPFEGAQQQSEAPCGPEQQLEAIVEQLATIEGDDPSTAEATTTAEAGATADRDPFDEQFAEEEVLVDRYGSDVEIFADVPRVSSWEGQQLGSLLEAVETKESWPATAPPLNVRLSEPSTEEVLPPAPLSEATAWAFAPASDPVLPEEEEESTDFVESAAATQTAEAPTSASAGVQPQSLDKLSGVANDRDLIVVEDEPQSAAHAPPGPAQTGEFRQLFAKLRRG